MDELWKQAIKDITDGSYSRVEKVLGGGDAFDNQILDWFNRGYFENEPEALAETVTCASFRGDPKLSHTYSIMASTLLRVCGLG